jgi:predicted transcriptional regulator
MNVRTNLLLPSDLVSEVDRMAGPRGRSRYVAGAIEQRLRRDRWWAAAQATVGAWKDHPLFPDDESVVSWVRTIRSEETDPGLEDE